MATRRYDADATKSEIIDAAEALFVEHGFANTSTGQIAKAAGVSQSQIHYHFQSKENLWREVHNRVFSDYFEAQLELLTADERGPELIERSMRVYYDFCESRPAFVRIMQFNLLESGGMGGDKSETLLQFGRKIAEREQEAGRMRPDVEAGFVVMLFLGAIHFWFEAKHEFVPKFGFDGEPDDYGERFLETATKIITRGMLP